MAHLAPEFAGVGFQDEAFWTITAPSASRLLDPALERSSAASGDPDSNSNSIKSNVER